MCTISIISNINYLLSGKFYHYFHKKSFPSNRIPIWYSIIVCLIEYPVNRVPLPSLIYICVCVYVCVPSKGSRLLLDSVNFMSIEIYVAYKCVSVLVILSIIIECHDIAEILLNGNHSTIIKNISII